MTTPVRTRTWQPDDEQPLARAKRGRWLRRIVLFALAATILAGAFGVLGVRTAEVRDQQGDWDLKLRYGRVTRPALATVWEVEVQRDGGFDEPIQIATTADYFDLFDENGLDPDPDKATVDGDMLIWEFDPPEGDTLTVSYDARIEPAVQWGMDARTEIRSGGEVVAAVDYRTTVLP